ncbi:NAD(P)/FAD-dependent oxidoreductase [uncultured Desulfovibrio sp.]|uniref:Dihydrolipoyl dehydrogenase n=1 Tax=Candidatus Desulfovibrio intestinavium TaxID=2838534 RepID=A0A9D2HLC8_9BACT|nr:NAD(P)/FAD-dependent oxidoreductase [uncultured Desulfovibrio sp.]HJA78277.1 NAD(P)/FAD-dependent oxidoreductase [Candidatus Desulfovibrio intestinavium]
MMTHDVCIIGGGPAGTRAARLLAAAGKKTVLVESAEAGGTCLNRGCIPTKMLLGAVTARAGVLALERQRVLTADITLDYAALHTRMQRFVAGTRQALGKQLAAEGIELLSGYAVCEGPGRVQVKTGQGVRLIEAEDIIIATGSRPASFPSMQPDHAVILDSTDMLASNEVPESLLVVGGGVIGLEMADIFHALGCTVTVVEAAPHILPGEDDDIAAEMAKALKKRGVTVLADCKTQALAARDGQAVLRLADGRELTAARALLAVGRRPLTQGLGCEHLGCRLDARGAVETDEFLEAASHVYAIGDVNGRVQLAHAAEHQALYAARRILGQVSGPYESGPVPACVYGSTEVMRVGLTARDAAAKGKVTVGVAPLSANPIAQAHGDISGFVKAVRCDGRLVGMAAVGHGVSHLVTAAQQLVLRRVDSGHPLAFMFAHPTLDESLAAALDAPQKEFSVQA